VDALNAALATGMTQREAMASLLEAHSSVLLKYNRGLEYIATLAIESKDQKMAVPVWRQWQRRLLDRLSKPSDNRKIIWVHDPNGGAGKSTLTKYLISHGLEGKGKACFLSGRLVDMMHTYSKMRSKIALFDVPRTAIDHRTHLAGFAEQLKNGFFNTTKYDSSLVQFEAPHVVFFSNAPPEADWWSADRLELITIVKKHLRFPGDPEVAAGDEVLGLSEDEHYGAGVEHQTFNAATVGGLKAPTMSDTAFAAAHGSYDGAAAPRTPKDVKRALMKRDAQLDQANVIDAMSCAQRDAFNASGPVALDHRGCICAGAQCLCGAVAAPRKRARTAGEGIDESGQVYVADCDDVSDSEDSESDS